MFQKNLNIYAMIRQFSFAYLHLAGDPVNGLNLTKTGVTGIALETVIADDGRHALIISNE